MGKIVTNFLISLLASSLVMKHNLEWHRKIIMVFIPLFFVFSLLQSEYIIRRMSTYKKSETQ